MRYQFVVDLKGTLEGGAVLTSTDVTRALNIGFQAVATTVHRIEVVEVDLLFQDMLYYKWRLEEILPLFEEARDAITAITLAQCKLYGISLSLADRMDVAGTKTREDFDIFLKETK